MVRLLLLSALLWAPVAHSDEIFLGQWSHHFGARSGEYNQTHSLVAYQRGDYLFGTFRNSHSKHTVVVGKKIFKRSFSIGELGIRAGLSTGYGDKLVFGLAYYSFGIIEINCLPTAMTSIGFKFKI